MTALERANELIYGQRAADYGDPVENFDRLAALWAPILGVDVTALQVCLCLNQLKVSRLINQPTHQDSVDDAAGYIGCYDRVLNERPERGPDLALNFNGEPVVIPGPLLAAEQLYPNALVTRTTDAPLKEQVAIVNNVLVTTPLTPPEQPACGYCRGDHAGGDPCPADHV